MRVSPTSPSSSGGPLLVKSWKSGTCLCKQFKPITDKMFIWLLVYSSIKCLVKLKQGKQLKSAGDLPFVG